MLVTLYSSSSIVTKDGITISPEEFIPDVTETVLLIDEVILYDMSSKTKDCAKDLRTKNKAIYKRIVLFLINFHQIRWALVGIIL